MKDTKANTRATEIAAAMKGAPEWDAALCRELCELAGMGDAWEQADGESFEGVVTAAAAALHVDIT